MSMILRKRHPGRALLCSAGLAALMLGEAPAWAGHDILYVATAIYADSAKNLKVGDPLPVAGGATAVANGNFPGVFNNDSVDGSFGVTAPILLSGFAVTTRADGSLRAGSRVSLLDVTAASKVATSFSSKSELALHVSTDGRELTMLGYLAPINELDVSNCSTPGNIDPTNPDIQTPTYRAVAEIDLGSDNLPLTTQTTAVNAYTGDNGRGAILAKNANGSGQDEYLLVGNASSGTKPPQTFVVDDTGVQAILTNDLTARTTVIGVQHGTPGMDDGYQFGFSVTQEGDTADKSGKDDNFRGEAIFGNQMYVAKGSGGNGINSVFRVTPPHGGLPMPATGSSTTISVLPGFPTGLATNIVEGDPTTEFYPFDIWFADANTMYVADEGSQDLNADPNAGLQKWILANGSWKLAYVIQAGLKLDQPYGVPAYPAADDPATTGLRHITGKLVGNTVTIFATTATFSSIADPGADPNKLVSVTDTLDSTTAPSGQHFITLHDAQPRVAYRGVVLLATN